MKSLSLPNENIVPYNGDSPMKPWPSLASRAFCLTNKSRPDESIFYFDSLPGDGISRPPVSLPVFILIHGLGDEADSWRHLIPLLNTGGYRVLALDLPGFGRSAAPGRISLKNHARAVLRLMEAACPGNQVILAGNSMGALVAEVAAVEKPGGNSPGVCGLILLDGSIPGNPPRAGFFALAKLLLSKKWYRAYRDNPEGAWASLYSFYADLDSLSPTDRDFLRRRVMARVESPSQEQAYFASYRSLVRTYLTASPRLARKIRDYKGKILLLWGEKDRIMPLSSVEPFKTLRPDAELQVIPGAGHLPQQEKPEETAQLMTEFIKL
jgi:pimeloyl-ACP methyl ester carboxylesterase